MRLPSPIQRKYLVRSHDSLTKIATQQYGDSRLWPEIRRANNVIEPGLIFVGQELTLPDIFVPNATYDRRPSLEAKQVAYPAQRLTHSVIIGKHRGRGYTLTGKLGLDLVIQRQGNLSAFTLTNLREIETKFRSGYQNEFTRLVSDFKVSYSAKEQKLKFSGAFSQTMRFKGKDWTSYEVEVVSPRSIKLTMKSSPVEGVRSNLDLKGTIEFEFFVELDDDFSSSASVSNPEVSFDLGRLFVNLLFVTVIAVGAIIVAPYVVAAAAAVMAALAASKTPIVAFAPVLFLVEYSRGPGAPPL